MNYVLLAMGALIFLSFKFKKAVKKDDFRILIFIRNNAPDAFINGLVGVSMILAGVSIPFTYMEIDFNVFLWVIVGFSGQILFKKLIEKFEGSKDEKS